jgi:pilus assembly protein Flp/PilA
MRGYKAGHFALGQETPDGEFEMRGLVKKVVSFLKREDGPAAVEYAVMLALIIVVCVAAVTTLGSRANDVFSEVGTKMDRNQSSP